MVRPIKWGQFSANEIAALKELREGRLTLVSVAAIAQRAHMVAARAERLTALVLKTAGADITPLPLNTEAVTATHLKVENELLHSRPQSAEEISDWARLLFSMGEEYFEAVKLYLHLEDPWKIYSEFATKTVLETPHDRLKVDPILRTAYGLFSAARNTLRQTAFFYVQKHYGKLFAHRAFPESMDDTHESILALAIM